jgi:hypothetical protein
MRQRLLIASVLVAVGASLTCTMALAATTKTTKKKMPTLASRTATCKADCKTGGLHGTYRAYNTVDPQLKSPEGRKLYGECVRLCLDPLPGFHIWKPIIDSGGSVFGETKADCMGCHAAGKPKRFWPGVNTLPDDLRR